jgi:hypothetical protein
MANNSIQESVMMSALVMSLDYCMKESLIIYDYWREGQLVCRANKSYCDEISGFKCTVTGDQDGP